MAPMRMSRRQCLVRNFIQWMLDLSASLTSGRPARLSRQAALVACVTGCLMSQTQAAPIAIDLGTLSTDVQSDYQTPSTSFEVTLTDNEVQWYSFTTGAITELDGLYLDIDTYPNNNHHVDTTIGLYDHLGNRVAVDADAGVIFFAQLSFGDSTPERGPLTYTEGSDVFSANPAKGINGNLAAGTYYLAVTRFQATFGETDFDVSSNSNGTDTFLLQFRGQSTSAIPEPSTIALLALGAGVVLHRVTARRRSRR